MNPIDEYVGRVLERLPSDSELRPQIEAEVRGHIAERMEHGHSVEEALRQLGDPAVLAESYLAAVPLVAAPFWDRVWAKLADFAIIVVAVAPLLWLSWLAGDVALIASCIFLLAFAIPLYAIVAEYQFARTVGKHLFGLRVVRESGARISLGQSIVRQLPAFFQVFWVDAMFALFTDRHQRAFELLSKTRVVLKPEVAS
jgi:uncharacterized RDD family membrane protein YckC